MTDDMDGCGFSNRARHTDTYINVTDKNKLCKPGKHQFTVACVCVVYQVCNVTKALNIKSVLTRMLNLYILLCVPQ